MVCWLLHDTDSDSERTRTNREPGVDRWNSLNSYFGVVSGSFWKASVRKRKKKALLLKAVRCNTAFNLYKTSRPGAGALRSVMALRRAWPTELPWCIGATLGRSRTACRVGKRHGGDN